MSTEKYSAKSDTLTGMTVAGVTGALFGISVIHTKHVYTYHLEFPSLNQNDNE